MERLTIKMETKKADFETAARRSKIVAFLDFAIAVYCAMTGNTHFAAFMVLAGLMWVCGVYFQSKAETEQGE